MTVFAAGRPSKRQVVGSAQASARGEDGPLPVSAGGTGATTEPEARAALGVPGLADTNLFSGQNTFNGIVSVGGLLSANEGLTVQGPFVSEETSSLGGPSVAYAAKTGTYTATATDCVVNCTSGTFTVALPAAAGAGAGRLYVVKNSGAGTITVDGDGAETIDGAATATVAAGAAVRLVCTGSAWITI